MTIRRARKRRVARKRTPESYVLREVLDFLAAHRILAFRMNVGAHDLGGGRFIRYGVKGMADVLAFPKVNGKPFPLWIEVKAQAGRQTFDQSIFQQCVEGDGHAYLLVRDSYAVEDWLNKYGKQ